MPLPLEGSVIVHGGNFVACGAPKRVNDVNMLRKKKSSGTV